MNWPALTAEVRDDPLGRGYSGMSDQQVADSLTQNDRPGAYAANILTIASVGQGEATRLAETLTAASAGNQLIAETLNLLRNGNTVDLNNPIVRGMLNQFATDGNLSLTTEDRDAVVSLPDNAQTRTQELSLGSVTEQHITRVRTWI